MFFIASKILAFIINPLLWIIIGFLFAWRKKGEKSASIIFNLCLISLLILTNPFLSNMAMGRLEYRAVNKDELPLSDFGVMLTGMTHIGQTPSDQVHFNEAADRFTETISLYKNKIISKIIISGGSANILDTEIREGTTLQNYALYTVNARDLIIEIESRNTNENAKNTKILLADHKKEDRPLILITSAFHMKRALACFENQGLNAIPFPVDFRSETVSLDIKWIIPNISSLANWNIIARELIGMWFYKIAGYA